MRLATIALAAILSAGVMLCAADDTRRASPVPVPHLVERVGTELVLIEACVTDARGRPIEDLGAQDFTLLVDGVARPLASFEFVRAPAAGTGPPAFPTGARQGPVLPALLHPRRFMLFFDDANSDPQGMTAARLAASKLVATAFDPTDEIALASYDTGLRILRDFTTDRQALAQALAGSLSGAKRIAGLYAERRARQSEIESLLREYNQKVATAGMAGSSSPAHIMNEHLTPKGGGGGTGPLHSSGMSGGSDAPDWMHLDTVAGPSAHNDAMTQEELNALLRQMKQLAIAAASDETPRLRALLRALGVLVDSLADWPGHRALVFMGDGIPENAALPYTEPITRQYPDSTFTMRAMTFTLAPEVEAVRLAAAAAGVTIHTLRSGGLAAGTATELAAISRQANTMEALAIGTGGIRGSSNDLLGELNDVENASRTYYVLGYAPEGDPDGRYHPVKVACRRAGIRVRAREGFVRFTALEARTRTIRAAHLLPDRYRDLPVDLSVALGPVTGAERVVDLVIHVPAERILFLPEDGRPTARVEIGLVALDEHGTESLRVARTMHIARLAGTEEAGGLEIYRRARLPDRAHQITVVVHDAAADLIGAARVNIEPSEIRPDVIQGLSLYSPSESSLWIEMPSGEDGGGGRGTAAHLVGPALKSTFEPGENAILGFRRPKTESGQAPGLIVVIRRGEEIVRSVSLDPPGAGARPTVKVALPVQGLAPGDYTVAVQERVEGAPVDRATVPLRIREIARPPTPASAPAASANP